MATLHSYLLSYETRKDGTAYHTPTASAKVRHKLCSFKTEKNWSCELLPFSTYFCSNITVRRIRATGPNLFSRWSQCSTEQVFRIKNQGIWLRKHSTHFYLLLDNRVSQGSHGRKTTPKQPRQNMWSGRSDFLTEAWLLVPTVTDCRGYTAWED